MLPDLRLPHEKLLAYQHALQLLLEIQELRIVDARLRDQITRASKSVCLNIAEAVGRFSDADRKRVYAIARGECCEAAAAIEIAPELKMAATAGTVLRSSSSSSTPDTSPRPLSSTTASNACERPISSACLDPLAVKTSKPERSRPSLTKRRMFSSSSTSSTTRV